MPTTVQKRLSRARRRGRLRDGELLAEEGDEQVQIVGYGDIHSATDRRIGYGAASAVGGSPLFLSILYALVCLLADLALTRCQDGRTRDVELLALRHEVRVLRRQVKGAAWQPGDRFVLAGLSRRLPRAAWGVLPVRPETLLRWHRELVRRKWAAFGRRRGPGRPPLATDVRDLIGRLADENPRWGYQRIRVLFGDIGTAPGSPTSWPAAAAALGSGRRAPR